MSIPYDDVAPAPATRCVSPGRISQAASFLIWLVAACQLAEVGSEWLQYAQNKDDPQSVYPLVQPDPMTAAGLAGSAALTTVSTALMVVAALYAVRVIRYVDGLQALRSVAR